MRPRVLGWLLVVLGMTAGACASGQSEQASPTSVETTVAQTTTTTEPTADGEEVEAYLVEMSNLASDLDIQLSDFEITYNEQFFSPATPRPGRGTTTPPEPTEEEQFEYQRGFWLGLFDIRLAHADVLASIQPPIGFETAHQKYVNAFRASVTHMHDQVAGFSDLNELLEFLYALFDPLAETSPELEQLVLGWVESCRALEDLGSEAGYRSNLNCPHPRPEAVSVDVEVGDEWTATPNPLAVGDGLVEMTITNTGNEAIRPVVVQIFEGDPLNLPVVDGVVDISQSGFFVPAAGFAHFNLAYAGEDGVFISESGVTGEPPELLPGESVGAVLWVEGPMVVFDYTQGQFESGAFVVIERSG